MWRMPLSKQKNAMSEVVNLELLAILEIGLALLGIQQLYLTSCRKKISRLDKECFYSLLCNLEPILAKEQRKAEINGSGGEISPKIMLLSTLRFLAGGMNIR